VESLKKEVDIYQLRKEPPKTYIQKLFYFEVYQPEFTLPVYDPENPTLYCGFCKGWITHLKIEIGFLCSVCGGFVERSGQGVLSVDRVMDCLYPEENE